MAYGMREKSKWEIILTTILVACALITTGVVLHRELVASTSSTERASARAPVLVNDWKSDLEQGVTLGTSSAPVKLLEFADFECPFCGDLHKKLKALREHYPSQVSLTYVHFPLPGHHFAALAARASECAGDQGRFEAMYDRLFEEQDSFGLKPWDDYAKEAGIPDLAGFESCVKQTAPVPRIEKGKQLGAKLDIKATPTVIVNGWMLSRPPTAEELDEMVKRILAGKSPIDGNS